MLSISRIIFLLFFPAGLGILSQVIWGTQLTHQLLAIGMFVFCIEQARMAVEDWQLIENVKVADSRLHNFSLVTFSTIFIELGGFYLSSIWIGWGAILILLSQIWFNLFASIKIGRSPDVILEWHILERLPVLIADLLGLVLISLWMLHIGVVWISWGLFGMAIAYCTIKLIPQPSLNR